MGARRHITNDAQADKRIIVSSLVWVCRACLSWEGCKLTRQVAFAEATCREAVPPAAHGSGSLGWHCQGT